MILPDKKYKTIIIDPPWKIGSFHNTGRLGHKIKPMSENYNTMTLEAIKQINIDELSYSDCALFLWTTHSFLPKAFEVLKSWGFKYHCCITWDKGHGLCHCGFYRKTEFCLFAYKGKLTKSIIQKGKYIPTIITERSNGHSKKPMVMYDWIESNAYSPRIELFARERRDGWDSWGNELSNTVQKLIT